MAAVTAIQIPYDRQMSTESGWENPFRPGGDLSREADEIVNMIKGGKPITPTGDNSQIIYNGDSQHESTIENGKNVQEVVTKLEVSNSQSAQNGTKSHQNKTENVNREPSKNISQTQVSKQIVPGPTSASHVVIENKKKKKCTCCVIQ